MTELELVEMILAEVARVDDTEVRILVKQFKAQGLSDEDVVYFTIDKLSRT
jgi:hypothetical protein